MNETLFCVLTRPGDGPDFFLAKTQTGESWFDSEGVARAFAEELVEQHGRPAYLVRFVGKAVPSSPWSDHPTEGV